MTEDQTNYRPRYVIRGWDFTQPLTPIEVATRLGVGPKTVARWAVSGKLVSFKTPGGHHRFSTEQVAAVIAGQSTAVGPWADEPKEETDDRLDTTPDE